MKNFMCLQELLGRYSKQLQYFDQDMAFYAYVRITKAQSGDHYLIVCVCVCVFFPFILDIKFVGRTSRGHTGGRSHRIFNPPSFCGACLDFCREKDSAIPFPRRP